MRFVRIAYPAEILKEVTFVDTPGTNDPNPLRSKITLDWIGSSDAVIFLMYAGAALAQQDMAFVDQYLRPVPSDRILIALSKADVVEDYRRPKSYVEQVLQSVPGFAKTLKHKDPYAIAPIFSLYPRLLERQKRGEIQLPPAKLKRIQHQLYGRTDKDFSELEEQQGFIPAFREAILAHLLATKGDGILASHAQKIRSAYEYALQARQIEVAQLQQGVADARLSDQELREKRRVITEVRDKLDRMVVEVGREKDNVLNPFKDATRRLVREMGTAIQMKATELIRNGEIDRLKRNLAWDLKNLFETQAEEVFKPAVEKEFKRAKSDIQLLFDRLKESAFNLDLFDGVFLQLVFRQFYITDLLEGLSKGINERFTERFLEKQRVNNFYFFQDKEKTAANVEAAIKEFFDSDGPWAQAIVGYAHDQFQKNVTNTFADINRTLEGELNRTSKDVEALLSSLDSKAQRLEDLQRQLLGVEREVDEMERELARINQELAGEPAAATA
ncbi:Dynamin family protein [compost metagenome]